MVLYSIDFLICFMALARQKNNIIVLRQGNRSFDCLMPVYNTQHTRIGTLSLPARLSIIGWYALSIFVDYGLGHHPPLTAVVPVTYVFWVAIALTTTIGALLLWLPYDLASYNAEETPTKPVTPRV